MSKYFYPLKICDIKRETRDAVVITLEVPHSLKSTYAFRSGQYLTFKQDIQGEEIRRSYSICSSPSEDTLSVAVKKVKNGKFSVFANEKLKVGDTLETMPPTGQFVCDYKVHKNILFFAAGSGITPIISHIKSLLHEHEDIHTTLIYGNKSFESIMFKESLEDLKNEYLHRLSIHHIFSKEKISAPLFFGRIDKEKCLSFHHKLYQTESFDAFYICGPNDMIFEVISGLDSLGIDPKKIHFELFSTEGLKPSIAKDSGKVSEILTEESQVTVQLDGDIHQFSLKYSGQNILDAAIAHGADLPFACKGGVCSTCKAKITQGTASMDVNYALEPDEIERGYILLCQAHPRTPHIYIDFDQK